MQSSLFKCGKISEKQEEFSVNVEEYQKNFP